MTATDSATAHATDVRATLGEIAAVPALPEPVPPLVAKGEAQADAAVADLKTAKVELTAVRTDSMAAKADYEKQIQCLIDQKAQSEKNINTQLSC